MMDREKAAIIVREALKAVGIQADPSNRELKKMVGRAVECASAVINHEFYVSNPEQMTNTQFLFLVAVDKARRETNSTLHEAMKLLANSK